MINTKKVLLIVFLISIPSVAIISSVYLFMKSKQEVKGVSIEKEGCNPYITNVIPNIAYVGEEYYFVPNIVGCDITEVELSINDVSWLYIKEGKYIYGIPSMEDVGTQKLEIVVYGRSSVYTLEDYIIVKSSEK